MNPCYVCGEAVPPPQQTITFSDGRIYDGADENGHFLCKACTEAAWTVFHTTAEWGSSEYYKMWVHNAAIEGLRVGRTSNKPQEKEDTTT